MQCSSKGSGRSASTEALGAGNTETCAEISGIGGLSLGFIVGHSL